MAKSMEGVFNGKGPIRKGCRARKTGGVCGKGMHTTRNRYR